MNIFVCAFWFFHFTPAIHVENHPFVMWARSARQSNGICNVNDSRTHNDTFVIFMRISSFYFICMRGGKINGNGTTTIRQHNLLFIVEAIFEYAANKTSNDGIFNRFFSVLLMKSRVKCISNGKRVKGVKKWNENTHSLSQPNNSRNIRKQ